MMYTVVGLIDPDSDELLVAGVIPGEHDCVDSGPLGDRFFRYAISVQASNPQEAERLAQCVVDP